MEEKDWLKVSKIYQQGMDSNKATFETKCPEYTIFDSSYVKECRLVAIDNENIAGWAALSHVSSSCLSMNALQNYHPTAKFYTA